MALRRAWRQRTVPSKDWNACCAPLDVSNSVSAGRRFGPLPHAHCKTMRACPQRLPQQSSADDLPFDDESGHALTFDLRADVQNLRLSDSETGEGSLQ